MEGRIFHFDENERLMCGINEGTSILNEIIAKQLSAVVAGGMSTIPMIATGGVSRNCSFK